MTISGGWRQIKALYWDGQLRYSYPYSYSRWPVDQAGIDRLASRITLGYFDAKARGLLDERGMERRSAACCPEWARSRNVHGRTRHVSPDHGGGPCSTWNAARDTPKGIGQYRRPLGRPGRAGGPGSPQLNGRQPEGEARATEGGYSMQ